MRNIFHNAKTFIGNSTSGVVYMTSPNIQTTHAFTTRFGGVSSGIFASLNLAHRTGDDPENVLENYTLVCRALKITTNDIVCSNQVHGTCIRVVTHGDRCKLFKASDHQADGLLTQAPGVALMIFVADCVPILLHDPVNNVIGAVHAGWRGTVSDIAGTAVRMMVSDFGSSPADVKAAIGPCISKCCYETDADVAHALQTALPETAIRCLTSRGDKYMTDLKEANRLLLTGAGLRDIAVSDECTSCSCDKYWSHRKTNGRRGSQAAVIMMGN